MATTALEKIAEIEAEAKRKIEDLKAEAISELTKRIAAAKAELVALEEEYSSLTGKTLKGEKVSGVRERLSKEQSEALVLTVSDIVKNAKEHIPMGEIIKQAGRSESAVRAAVKAAKAAKMIDSTGDKAATRYFPLPRTSK